MTKPCRVLAVANMKGGVGKTTTVVGLSETFAARQRDARVLVVDMDPQGSASFCLAGDELLTTLIESNRTLQAFFEARFERNPAPIEDYIAKQFSYTTHLGTQLPIDLMATGPELRLFERNLLVTLTRAGQTYLDIVAKLHGIVKGCLRILARSYTHIVFDCPPGLSVVAEAAIGASDAVVVPTIPDEVSNFGLNAFCRTLWSGAPPLAVRPPLPHVLLNRVQPTRQHGRMASMIEAEAAASDRIYELLSTRIRQSTELSRAIAFSDHTTYQRKYPHDVARSLDELATEIDQVCDRRLGGRDAA